MKESLIETISRAFGEDSSRRGMLQGLTGLALTSGFARIGLEDTEAKKRKKKKKKRKGRSNQGDNAGGTPPLADPPGGPPPGGAPPCTGTLCTGQCVDLNRNPSNCGACGASCNGNETCVEGRCVEIIGSRGNGDGQLDRPFGIALNANGVAFVVDTGNDRLVVLGGGNFGDAQFVEPVGVAVNLISGDIYVSDLASDLVTRMSETGTVLNSCSCP